MRIEIRSGNQTDACQYCGAGELVYSGGKPVSADLTRVMEREIIHREVGMARMMRDHLNKADDDAAERERRMAEQFKSEHWQLTADVTETLLAAKVDVPAWRVWRKRRERLFAERIDEAIAELKLMTRFGNG